MHSRSSPAATEDAKNDGLDHEGRTNDIAMRADNTIDEITAQFAQIGLDPHSEDDVARDGCDDEDEAINADTDSDADTDADADQDNQTKQFALENDSEQVESDFAWPENLTDDEINNRENTVQRTPCCGMKRL